MKLLVCVYIYIYINVFIHPRNLMARKESDLQLIVSKSAEALLPFDPTISQGKTQVLVQHTPGSTALIPFNPS